MTTATDTTQQRYKQNEKEKEDDDISQMLDYDEDEFFDCKLNILSLPFFCIPPNIQKPDEHCIACNNSKEKFRVSQVQSIQSTKKFFT